MPSRRDVIKTGAGLAILSLLPGGLGSADAQEALVSGPSFGTSNKLDSPRSEYIDIKNGLGCRIVRSSVHWSDIEATRGSYNWAGLDSLVNNCQAAGLKVLIPIAGPQPGWAGGGLGAPSGEILTSYVNLCRAIAARFRNKTAVEAYEVWNEPNGHGPDAAWSASKYIKVINAVAPAIKAADPNVLVAGPAMAGLLEGTFAVGILNDAQAKANLDVFTAHAYCRPAAPEVGTSIRAPFDPRVAASLTMLANAGYRKPFWVTEMGWRTAGAANFLNSLADQARYIVRGAIIIRAQGVRVYQHEYNGVLEEGMLGKPSYAAYKTLNRIVGNGLTSLTKITHPTAWVYKFTRAALPIGYVLWTVSGTANVTLTGLAARVRTTTISGISSIVSTARGKLQVAASIDPLYIENI